ncbi:MAG: hypothetical protein V3T77_04050 [Planctomycetota bacterium]
MVEELLPNRSDSELRQKTNEALWQVVCAWGEERAAADAKRPLSKVGHWELGEEENFLVNCGYLNLKLYQDALSAEDLHKRLAQFSDTDPKETLPILFLSDLLIESYREHLCVEAMLEIHAEKAVAEQRVQDEIMCLEQLEEEQRLLLEQETEQSVIQPLQEKLEQLLPHLARVTQRFRTGGAGRHENNVLRKVLGTSRKITQRILYLMKHYTSRKCFEDLQSRRIQQMIRFQEAELHADAVSAESEEKNRPITVSVCQESVAECLKLIRTKLALVSRTPQDIPPPYILEHTPRLPPKEIVRIWKEILKACPRFEIAHKEGWYDTPRVVILPGTGNPIYDTASGDVLATLFPLEVLVHSIIGALGEAYLRREREIREEYRLLKWKQSEPTDEELQELFHKDFILWVVSESQGQRAMEPKVAQWFHRVFVLRRTQKRP